MNERIALQRGNENYWPTDQDLCVRFSNYRYGFRFCGGNDWICSFYLKRSGKKASKRRARLIARSHAVNDRPMLFLPGAVFALPYEDCEVAPASLEACA